MLHAIRRNRHLQCFGARQQSRRWTAGQLDAPPLETEDLHPGLATSDLAALHRAGGSLLRQPPLGAERSRRSDEPAILRELGTVMPREKVHGAATQQSGDESDH